MGTDSMQDGRRGEKTVSKGPSGHGGWWRAWEEMQCHSCCRHRFGRGFKGPFQWIIALSCSWGFSGGYQPWFCATGLGGRNCHRAEKAVLSTVGFYTNKIKYHRQEGLCVASSTALVVRVQAVVIMAHVGVTGGGWSGSCRPHFPAGLAPALSFLTVPEL